MKGSIKICIADDHELIRRGFKQIIAEEPDMAVVGEAKNADEVLDFIRKKDCDVIILDISMPGRSGLDLLKELKVQKPKLPVLILSMYPEELYAVRTLKAGAGGYLTKDSASEELVKAIRKVVEGKKYVSPTLSEKLAFDLEIGEGKPLHEHLSDREYQVMCMIASGKTVKDIAQELFLSVKTISTFRFRILEKMRMKNNAELTHYAVKHHLID
ncbi:MAG: response regulator transcription factor [Nitrospirota bacterium]